MGPLINETRIFIFVLFFMMSDFLWLMQQSIQLESSASFAGAELTKWLDNVVINGTLLLRLTNAAGVLEVIIFILFDLVLF